VTKVTNVTARPLYIKVTHAEVLCLIFTLKVLGNGLENLGLGLTWLASPLVDDSLLLNHVDGFSQCEFVGLKVV